MMMMMMVAMMNTSVLIAGPAIPPISYDSCEYEQCGSCDTSILT